MQKYLGVISAALLLIAFASAITARGQEDEPILSPPAKAQFTFTNGKTIKVDYSSPRMRGRQIFGGLVPYGEVWRAGANEATTFVSSTNVIVSGKKVPAGSYTLFALPTANRWTLIISKETGEWGIPYPGAASDFARVDMNVSKSPKALEDFTIGFEKAGNGCVMYLEWATTRASVQIVPAS